MSSCFHISNKLAAPEKVLQMKSVIRGDDDGVDYADGHGSANNNKDEFCKCGSVKFIVLYVN